jgi:hypothetical protein
MAKPVRGGERPDRDGLEHEDIRAALAARSELGPAYEPEIVEQLAEKIEAAIESRADARWRRAAGASISTLDVGNTTWCSASVARHRDPHHRHRERSRPRSDAGRLGGVGAVNAAHALQGRRRR